MLTGYCRHDWRPCSPPLRALLPRFEGEAREFRACARCLRIEEMPPTRSTATFAAPAGVEPPRPAEASPEAGEGDDEAAA